ncbi:hypothetical protein A6P54_12140 [Bacillus sp. MKU004]|nr:hypothetical protein A6P54_12140 [Bacillus sp. MKU004]
MVFFKLDTISYRFQQLIGVHDVDSCGKSEAGETPQEHSSEEAPRSPAESEIMHGNPLRYNEPSPSKVKQSKNKIIKKIRKYP